MRSTRGAMTIEEKGSGLNPGMPLPCAEGSDQTTHQKQTAQSWHHIWRHGKEVPNITVHKNHLDILLRSRWSKAEHEIPNL